MVNDTFPWDTDFYHWNQSKQVEEQISFSQAMINHVVLSVWLSGQTEYILNSKPLIFLVWANSYLCELQLSYIWNENNAKLNVIASIKRINIYMYIMTCSPRISKLSGHYAPIIIFLHMLSHKSRLSLQSTSNGNNTMIILILFSVRVTSHNLLYVNFILEF